MKKRGVHHVVMSQTQIWVDDQPLDLSFFGWLNHPDSQKLLFEKCTTKNKCRLLLHEDLCYTETITLFNVFTQTRFQTSPEMKSKIQHLFEKSGYQIKQWIYVRQTLMDRVQLWLRQGWKYGLIILILSVVIGYLGIIWKTNQAVISLGQLDSALALEKKRHFEVTSKRPDAWKKENEHLFTRLEAWSHFPGTLSQLRIEKHQTEASGSCLPVTCEEAHDYLVSAIGLSSEWAVTGTSWTVKHLHSSL